MIRNVFPVCRWFCYIYGMYQCDTSRANNVQTVCTNGGDWKSSQIFKLQNHTAVHFCYVRNRNHNFKINDTQISRSDDVKYLGLKFDQKLLDDNIDTLRKLNLTDFVNYRIFHTVQIDQYYSLYLPFSYSI